MRAAVAAIELVPWGLLLAAAAIYAAAISVIALLGRGEAARAMARFVPDLAVLVARLARDPRVPRRRRAPLLLLAGYLALPVDLIPDFVPVAGQLDDAVLTALVLRFFLRGGSEEMLREAWPGPEAGLRVVLRAAGVAGSAPRPKLPLGR